MVAINQDLEIPEAELEFVTSRSAGPGGQNVNKVETRVTVRFDLAGSPSLDDEQRARIGERLATRVTKAGILQVTSQRHRTQAANRDAALARLVELLAAALEPERERRATKPPRASKRRRLDSKKRRGRVKELRQKPGSGDAW